MGLLLLLPKLELTQLLLWLLLLLMLTPDRLEVSQCSEITRGRCHARFRRSCWEVLIVEAAAAIAAIPTAASETVHSRVIDVRTI